MLLASTTAHARGWPRVHTQPDILPSPQNAIQLIYKDLTIIRLSKVEHFVGVFMVLAIEEFINILDYLIDETSEDWYETIVLSAGCVARRS